MESLANVVVATADLVEAEGRALRRHLVRLGLAVAMIVVSSLLGIFGFGFLLYGLYWLLAQQLSAPMAALVFGTTALALSGGFLWTTRRLVW